MISRSNIWMVLACAVLVASPLLQIVMAGGGIRIGAVLVAAGLGAVAVAVYLQVLRRARRSQEDARPGSR